MKDFKIFYYVENLGKISRKNFKKVLTKNDKGVIIIKDQATDKK